MVQNSISQVYQDKFISGIRGMTMTAYLTQSLNSPLVRPPLRPLPDTTVESIRAAFTAAGETMVR